MLIGEPTGRDAHWKSLLLDRTPLCCRKQPKEGAGAVSNSCRSELSSCEPGRGGELAGGK